MRNVTLVALCLAMFLMTAAAQRDAHAEPRHDLVKPATVYLHAKGKAKSGANMGQFIDSHATGFLVSEDGLVMTVYHLIQKLGDVEPATVTIKARLGSKDANEMKAWIIDAKITTDLLLLRLASQGPHPKVTLGSAQDHREGDTIYSYGFPSMVETPYINPTGTIESRFGPGGYLWITGINFTPGESGSPVYNEQGQVIGIVKGTEEGKGLFIPIGAAESLLARVRFNEIRAAMKDFDLLRTQFFWSGRVKRVYGKEVIEITYHKSVSGEPHVKEIDIQIRAVGIQNGETKKMARCCRRMVTWSGDSGATSRSFVLDEEIEAVEELQEYFQYSKLLEVEVDIVPHLSDGEKLRRTTVIVDLEDGAS